MQPLTPVGVPVFNCRYEWPMGGSWEGLAHPLPLCRLAGHSYLAASGKRPRAAVRERNVRGSITRDGARALVVPDLVAAHATAAPEAVAVCATDSTLTYGDLNTRANQLAHHLRRLGVERGVLVGLGLRRSPDLVVAALAILKAGGAYVPLDPEYPIERLAFMLADAKPPVLIAEADQAARVPGPWQPVVLERERSSLEREPVAEPVPTADAGDLAYVIYTSGSTGRPKGVEITHASLLNLVNWHRRAFAVTASDRATQLASPGFDACVWELWPHLAAGASVHLADDATRLDPEVLRDWLVRQRITIAFVPTPLAERMLVLPWPRGGALRALLTGADTLHHYPSPALPFALVNNYGPTEATVVATSGIVPPGSRETLPPIGRPIDNVQVHILDEARQPVTPGERGEVYIGGVGVARGYLNRPDLTAERFVPDPFVAVHGARLYRTGDLARRLPDGTIAFVGRADEQIKVRGFRIEPDEIVAALATDPSVRASSVAARDDGSGERRLVAYVVPAPGADPSLSALAATLRRRLPEYMVPAVFVRLDALPLTPNGKVDRGALPAPESATVLRDPEWVAPRTTTERELAAILAALLGTDRVGATDNFFLLGGHSLLGTQVISRVRERFGVELSLKRVFDTPTVAALSEEIEQLILAKLAPAATEPRAA